MHEGGLGILLRPALAALASPGVAVSIRCAGAAGAPVALHPCRRCRQRRIPVRSWLVSSAPPSLSRPDPWRFLRSVWICVIAIAIPGPRATAATIIRSALACPAALADPVPGTRAVAATTKRPALSSLTALADPIPPALEPPRPQRNGPRPALAGPTATADPIPGPRAVAATTPWRNVPRSRARQHWLIPSRGLEPPQPQQTSRACGPDRIG